MQNNSNARKHMTYSSLLFNLLIILALIANFHGYNYILILILALILPIYFYSMKSKRFFTIKETFLYSIWLTFPMFAISACLYALSLLIAPLGLLFLDKLIKYAAMIWFSVFLSFILFNFFFVFLYKQISQTKFYQKYEQYLSLITLFLIKKSVIITSLIITGTITIFLFLSQHNPMVVVGYSDMLKWNASTARVLIYNQNKLLFKCKKQFEVFDIDKKEMIKSGIIEKLKFYDGIAGALIPINDNKALIIELLEYHHNNIQGSHLYSMGILNLNDFAYTPIGEYVLDSLAEGLAFEYENGKCVFVPDLGSKAYIFDINKNKIEPFSVETFERAMFGNNIIQYKDKYFVINSFAFKLEPHEEFSPLIQEFNPVNKTLTTVFKKEKNTNQRYLKTILYKDCLIIISEFNNEPYKLILEYFDINKGEKIAEKQLTMPNSKFHIYHVVLQNNKLSIFGAATRYKYGFYTFNLDTESLDKKFIKTRYYFDNNAYIINLENGDTIIYDNVYLEDKILLYKNDIERKLSK